MTNSCFLVALLGVISSQVLQVFALPQVPQVPAAPQIPSVNTAPQVPPAAASPQVPSVTTAPQVPSLAAAPQIPSFAAAPDVRPVRNNTQNSWNDGNGSGSGDTSETSDLDFDFDFDENENENEAANDSNAESRSNSDGLEGGQSFPPACYKDGKEKTYFLDTVFTGSRDADGVDIVSKGLWKIGNLYYYNIPDYNNQWPKQKHASVQKVMLHVEEEARALEKRPKFPFFCFKWPTWLEFINYFKALTSAYHKYVLEPMIDGFHPDTCRNHKFDLQIEASDVKTAYLAHIKGLNVVGKLFAYWSKLGPMQKYLLEDGAEFKKEVQRVFFSNVNGHLERLYKMIRMFVWFDRGAPMGKDFFFGNKKPIVCAPNMDTPHCKVLSFFKTATRALIHVRNVAPGNLWDSKKLLCLEALGPDLGQKVQDIIHLWFLLPTATDVLMSDQGTLEGWEWVNQKKPSYYKRILESLFEKVSNGETVDYLVKTIGKYTTLRESCHNDCEETRASYGTSCVFSALLLKLERYDPMRPGDPEWEKLQAEILTDLLMTEETGKHIDVSYINNAVNSIGPDLAAWKLPKFENYYRASLNFIFLQVSSEDGGKGVSKSLFKESSWRKKLENDCTKFRNVNSEASRSIPCLFKSLFDKLKLFVNMETSDSEWKHVQNGILVFLMTTETLTYIDFTIEQASKWSDLLYTHILNLVENNENDKLNKLLQNLPKTSELHIRNECVGYASDDYKESLPCFLYGVLRQLDIYQKTKQSVKGHCSVLNIEYDWKEKLKEYKIDETVGGLGSQMKALEATFTKSVHDLKEFTSDSLTENFQAIGTYFKGISNFDVSKANADIAFLSGRLTEFNNDQNKYFHDVEKTLTKLLDNLRDATQVQMGEKIFDNGAKVAAACNPLDPDPGAFIDAGYELRQAAKDIELANLWETEYRRAVLKSLDIAERFQKNSDFLKMTIDLVNKLEFKRKHPKTTDSPEFLSLTEQFLKAYNDYDPKVKREEIVEMGALWDMFISNVCAKMDGMNGVITFALASVSHKDCLTIQSRFARLMTLYEEKYDYQDQLMTSLAAAVRAHISHHYAKQLAPDGVKIQDHSWKVLKISVERLTFFLTYRKLLFSTAGEYCNQLTYKNAGVSPQACEVGLVSLGKKELSEIITYNLPKYSENREEHFNIPTAKDSWTGPHGFIDLELLYKDKNVTFQIPNHAWLVKAGWISESWNKADRAIYLYKFKPYIKIPGVDKMIEFEVSAISPVPVVKGGKNKENKFVIQPYYKFEFRYKQNYPGCNNELNTADGKICQFSDDEEEGETNYDIKPSVFSMWKIKLQTNIPNPPDVTKASKVEAFIQLKSRPQGEPTKKLKKTKKN